MCGAHRGPRSTPRCSCTALVARPPTGPTWQASCPDLRPSIRRMSDPRLALAYLPVVGRSARRSLAALGPRERVLQVLRLCYADMSQVSESRIREAIADFETLSAQRWAGPALAASTIGLIRLWLVPKSKS